MRLASLAFAFAVVACAKTAPPQPDTGALADDYPIRRNPKGPDGRVLYMGGTEGCHWVDPGVVPATLEDAINATEPTSCLGLEDPVWRECPFGGVFEKEHSPECLCRSTRATKTMARCPP